MSRRMLEHGNGVKGAKYLRGKGPLKLIYQQKIGDRSLASKVESRIKRLPKPVKEDAAILTQHIQSFIAQSAEVGD